MTYKLYPQCMLCPSELLEVCKISFVFKILAIRVPQTHDQKNRMIHPTEGQALSSTTFSRIIKYTSPFRYLRGFEFATISVTPLERTMIYQRPDRKSEKTFSTTSSPTSSTVFLSGSRLRHSPRSGAEDVAETSKPCECL